MSSTNQLVVKDKVQRFAKQFFNVVSLDDDGDLSIPFESTHIHVSVFENISDDPELASFRKENDISTTTVMVWAMVLMSVKPSDALYKWISIDGQLFDYGGFRIVPTQDGLCNVIFQYNLPGDTLDAGELKNALACVGFTANGEDEELQSKFGGKRVTEIRDKN